MSEITLHPRVPLKFIAKITSGGTPGADSINWNGVIPFVTPPDLNGLDGKRLEFWGRSLAQTGTKGSSLVDHAVMLSCRAPIGHIGTVEQQVAFNQGCKSLQPSESEDVDYLAYALVSERKTLSVAGRGTTFLELSSTDLASCSVPWPSGGDVRKFIADYLDRETGAIDAMIVKMDELAATLVARKRNTASYVWSLGFNRVKLKWLINEVDDRAGGAADLPLLSVSIHHGVQLRSESTSKQRASEDLSSYKVARNGEIVLNRMRAFQGGLGLADRDGLVSPDYSVIRANPTVLPSWAERVMRTPEFIAGMTQWLRGIGGVETSSARTPRINFSDLIELEIPVPSITEQKRIADHLDEVTSRIDQMLAKVFELKSLLIERRTALIADVVTGRKEVA